MEIFAVEQKGEPMAEMTFPIQVDLPDDWVEQIVNRLRDDPEAEWVEIIRCKECKHSFLHDNGERTSRICGLTRMCGTTSDNWYCADAERKEE